MGSVNDTLLLYRGADYEINSKIRVHQPTLDEICVYGEQRYFGLVRLLCATPADQKVEIWDGLHIYWDQMDEFDLFLSMFSSVRGEDVAILLPGLDMDSFTLVAAGDMKEKALRNKDGVVIDRAIHALLTDCIRKVHKLTKNTEVGYNDYTKDIMIEDDRNDREAAKRKPFVSVLQPIISSMTNSVGFKYRFDDVWTMPIGAFLDAVGRVQKIKSYDFLMHGAYSGCVDMKKVSKKQLDWMGELK